MFKISSYRLCSFILILTLIFFSGCGGSESGLDGDAAIAVEMTAHDTGDAGADPTLAIDTVWSLCPQGEDQEPTSEPFFDALGQAKFTYIFYCPTCPPGAGETYIIESYTVEYIPRKSPDGVGGFFLPPKLVNLDQRILSHIVLSKDFKTAERTVILVPVNTKAEYVNKSQALGTSIQSIYSIRVTFHGKNRAGNSFDQITDLEVFFGNYNRCEG